MNNKTLLQKQRNYITEGKLAPLFPFDDTKKLIQNICLDLAKGLG